jgi:hypothetical protein
MEEPMADMLKPGDFPIGSLESRMAMRAQLAEQDDGTTHVLVSTGLPLFFDSPPIIEPPDSIAHFEAQDGSIVELIRREYEPGKFTAFIHQSWKGGSEYRGGRRVDRPEDLARMCRPMPLANRKEVEHGHP